MMSPIRKEILERLTHLCELDRDCRFGQLVANLVAFSTGPYKDNIWEIEDEELLESLKQIESDFMRREEESTAAA